MREQRIRCLLAGAWCHNHSTNEHSHDEDRDYRQRTSNLTSVSVRSSQDKAQSPAWVYVVLSHNRRQLHYGTFPTQLSTPPIPEALSHRLDLSKVSKIEHSSDDSVDGTTLTIALIGFTSPSTSSPPTSPQKARQTEDANTIPLSAGAPATLLTLHMPTSALHSEWLYGLQVLSLSASAFAPNGAGTHTPYTATQKHPQNHSHSHSHSQPPALPPSLLNKQQQQAEGTPVRRGSATASLRRRRAKQDSTSASAAPRARNDLDEPDEPQTQALVDALVRYGVKLRMLNVRWDYEGIMNVQGQAQESEDESDGTRQREKRRFVVPSREGVDEEFFYDIGGAGVGK